MKYFSSEDSKKLQKLGLSIICAEHLSDGRSTQYYTPRFSTLDIAELPNAKKLWGDKQVTSSREFYTDLWLPDGGGILPVGLRMRHHLNQYIILSDEERIKYVKNSLFEQYKKPVVINISHPIGNSKNPVNNLKDAKTFIDRVNILPSQDREESKYDSL